MIYVEVMEMFYFGVKVIYLFILQLVLFKKILFYIKNIFNLFFEGILIFDYVDFDGYVVKGIFFISYVVLLILLGSGLFGVLGIVGCLFFFLVVVGINIIFIIQGFLEYFISFVVQLVVANKVCKCVEEEFEYEMSMKVILLVKIEEDFLVVVIIGENMWYQLGILGWFFQVFGYNGINVVVIVQGFFELNVLVVINWVDEVKVFNVLYEFFFFWILKSCICL